MGLGDLFKTDEQRKKEADRRRMRARSGAERVADRIKDKVGELKHEKDAAWKEAVQHQKAGDKSSGGRSLKTYQFLEQQINQLEARRWSFEGIARQFELASFDADIKNSLGQLNIATEIDVVELEGELTNAFDKVRDINDANKLWDRIGRKQMDGVATSVDGTSIEELQGRLDAAVAGDLAKESQHGKLAEPSQSAISQGRQELNDLLNKPS